MNEDQPTEYQYRTERFPLAVPIITDELGADGLPTVEALKADYDMYVARIQRFEWLERYYMGQNAPIYNYDVSPMSNYCEYFADFLTNYMTGIAPSYSFEDGDKYAKEIIGLYAEQNMEQQEASLILDMAMFGRAFQLVYENMENEPRAVTCSPLSSYVTYNDQIDRDSVYGALVREEKDKNGVITSIVDVYTAYMHVQYVVTGKNENWAISEKPMPHRFNRVPLIEYVRGKYGKGHFEGIISLQDAFNALQEDRVEDKHRFALALLLIKGAILSTEQDEQKAKLRKHKKIGLLQIDENAEASYLTRIFDETSVQVLQDNLSREMHKLAKIPDLSDEKFAGNSSGVAMQYKLLGTESLAGEFAIAMAKGFSRRCKLYDEAIYNSTAAPTYKIQANVSNMEINFKYNVPIDVVNEINALKAATEAGIMSQQTALDNFSMIKDTEEELKRLEEEATKSAERQRDIWSGDEFNPQPQDAGQQLDDSGNPLP